MFNYGKKVFTEVELDGLVIHFGTYRVARFIVDLSKIENIIRRHWRTSGWRGTYANNSYEITTAERQESCAKKIVRLRWRRINLRPGVQFYASNWCATRANIDYKYHPIVDDYEIDRWRLRRCRPI